MGFQARKFLQRSSLDAILTIKVSVSKAFCKYVYCLNKNLIARNRNAHFLEERERNSTKIIENNRITSKLMQST